jgi:hypothetical protein
MEEVPTRDEFAANKNTIFSVSFGPESTVDMKLVEVSEAKEQGRTERFSLLFLAPPNTPIIQSLFGIAHPVLGPMELFLVPVGQDEKGVEFEAVFNRIVKPKADYS